MDGGQALSGRVLSDVCVCVWLGEGGWEGSAPQTSGARGCCIGRHARNGPTQHWTFHTNARRRQRRQQQPFGALSHPLEPTAHCLPLFLRQIHIVSIVQRVRVACNAIIDSRVIVSWNQGPAPTTAANSTPSFNLALFLRIERLNPLPPNLSLFPS
jgi:hypothetical protein